MKVLFQGDSITDAGRDRSDPHDLGGGYPKYAAQYIREAMPETEFEFLDLGISGDQTVMYNASSYTHQLVAEHLFKKIMSESGRFGKIKLDGREFISGSHFCLECKT